MKKETGITLIALAITIVVLLILVGVSITSLTEDEGIVTKANEAKEESASAREQEESDIGDIYDFIEENVPVTHNAGTLVVKANGYADYYGEESVITEIFTNVSAEPWSSYKSSIKNVLIEEGVTSIGNNAFSYCSSLETVTIPSSVTVIGNNAFYNCVKLTTVKYYGSLEPTYGSGVFGNVSAGLLVLVTGDYEGELFCDALISRVL